MKRDLSAAIIFSLLLHAVLLGVLHVAVLPAGRDMVLANAGEGATAGGGVAPIRVVMSDRRAPGDAGGPGRADGAAVPDSVGLGGRAGTAGGAGRGTGEASRRTPERADRPPDAGADAEISATNAHASNDLPAGRDTSADSAGDSTSDDGGPAGEPANDLAAHSAASAENPFAPETRAPRPPRLATPIEPEYPFRARRLGHEGTVAFTVLVGGGGAVLDITLDESSGHAELDQAARAAVGHASYIPGSSRAPMPLRVRVVFEIEDGVFN